MQRDVNLLLCNPRMKAAISSAGFWCAFRGQNYCKYLRDGCIKYSRLCFTWDRVAVNHMSDSVCSGVSSNFDLATGDLSKYSSLVNELKDTAVQLELGLDELPPSHLHRRNPRYGQERLQKDIDNEEVHLSKLEAMMINYREQNDCLRDFETEMFDLDGDRSTEVPGDDFGQNPRESFLQFTQARDLEHALKAAADKLKVATEDTEKEQPGAQSSATSKAAKTKLNADPTKTLKKNVELTSLQDGLFAKSVLVRSRR